MPRRSLMPIMSNSEREREEADPLLVGVLPVTSQNWQLMRMSPRAALSRICILSPNSNVIIQEEEECVRRVLEEIEASDSRTEEASEGESFIDIMGGLEEEVGSESEGLTLAEILRRADPLSETVLEGMVSVPVLPLC